MPPTWSGKVAYFKQGLALWWRNFKYAINPCAKPNKKDAAIKRMLTSEDYCERRKSQMLISHIILLFFLGVMLLMEHKSKFSRSNTEDDGF